MTTQELLSRLDHVRPIHGGWQARCPAHDDRTPSLNISESEGKILLCCHAGCETSAIVAALGLRMTNLFSDPKPDGGGGRIVATYDYADETGKLLFQVVRYQPKAFKQRRPDGRGGWLWSLDGQRPVLFNLPAVVKATSILIPEGEKDCQTAARLGLTATCNPGGAGKWRSEYSESLRGKDVAVICDADPAGLAHGHQVARSLVGIAQSVRLVEALPQAKDLSEWHERGGQRDALLRIIGETPALTPADVARWQPAKPATGFKLTSLADLLSKPDIPVDYVLQDTLVAGTSSAMVSKPKVGKSTLARNLCLAVSRGEDFLGLAAKQGECIYLALEEREEDIKNDFRAMGADGSEPILIHAAGAPAEGIRALCDLVKERKPRLVVIDPLFRLARVQNESAYAEVYAALGPLIDLSRETSTHVMVLHHSGKGIGKADPVDSPLGSTAIGGAVSTLVVLKRTEAHRTIQTVQRIGKAMPEMVLNFDSETRRLSIGGTRLEADQEKCESAIVEFLKAAGEPQTQAQVRDGVEGQTRAIRAALTALVKCETVKKTGDGTRGKPSVYENWFAGSQHTAGTREPESEKVAQTRMDVGPILVPALEQKTILVPATKQDSEPAFFAPENQPSLTLDSGPDAIEI